MRQGAGLAVQVAHHWYAALDLPRAFSASLAAADAAQAAHAPQEEMQMLERALQLWARVTNAESVAGCDRAALLERAADAAFDAGDDDRQDTFSKAALAAVDSDSDPQRHAHLLSRHLGHSQSLSAEEFLAGMDRALAVMPPDAPSPSRAWALWKLAQWHLMLGHVVAADLAVQARAEAQRVSDREVESFAVGILAFAQAVAGWGELDTGLGLLEEARQLAVEAGSERALLFYRLSLSELLMIMGRFNEARQVCVEGRERVQRSGLNRTHEKVWAVNEVAALVALGRWDEALALADHLLAQDLPHFSELALSHLRAEVLTYRGDPHAPDAVAALDRVTAWTGNDPQRTFPIAMVRAEHALALGDPDGALSILLDTLADLGRPLAYTAWAMLHTLARTISTIEQGGDAPQHARDTLAHARQSFTHSGIQHAWDAVIDAELTPSTDDTATDRWEAAYRELTHPDVEGPAHLRAYTAYRLGAALLAADRRDDAAPLLTAAFDQVSALRATPLIADITTLALRRGIPLPGVHDNTAEPAGAGVRLTPREREVLQLLADAHSNAQIAGELFIGPKTVSVHVANILAKLGASSRSEAAAIAHQQGLAHTPGPPA